MYFIALLSYLSRVLANLPTTTLQRGNRPRRDSMMRGYPTYCLGQLWGPTQNLRTSKILFYDIVILSSSQGRAL